MIELDDGVRLQRALDREKAQDHPKYEELCRRYLADAQDFSEEKLALSKINKPFTMISLKAAWTRSWIICVSTYSKLLTMQGGDRSGHKSKSGTAGAAGFAADAAAGDGRYI